VVEGTFKNPGERGVQKDVEGGAREKKGKGQSENTFSCDGFTVITNRNNEGRCMVVSVASIFFRQKTRRERGGRGQG